MLCFSLGYTSYTLLALRGRLALLVDDEHVKVTGSNYLILRMPAPNTSRLLHSKQYLQYCTVPIACAPLR